MSQYTTHNLIELFGVSHQTVKAWSAEFREFLSPTATPPAGQKRIFTDDDLRVFALVSDFKQRGLTFADAHAALHMGQRGDISAPSAIETLPAAAKAVILRLRDEMEALHTQLDSERTRADKAAGQVELLERQISELKAELREAYKQIGRLEG